MQLPHGKEFQRCLLASVWEDPRITAAGDDLVRPSYFSDELHGAICAAVLSFFEREKAAPDLGALLEELRAPEHALAGRTYDEVSREARKVNRRRGKNTEYYHRQAADFARKRAVFLAVREAHRDAQNGDLDAVAGRISSALSVGRRGPSMYRDYFRAARGRRRAWEANGKSHGVPTGLGPIDEALGGGLRAGRLAIVEALPGHGKTTTLIFMGGHAVLTGHNVLHVTVENPADEVESRYDALFMGRPMRKVRKMPKKFLGRMGDLRRKLGSRLLVSEFPAKSLTPAQLKSVIAGADPHPDLVIIDYIDEMKAGQKREERRHELADLYGSVRGLAGELGVPIWSASQANRPAFQSKRIDMRNLAECHEKAGIIDFGMSLNYTPEEQHAGVMNVLVFKNRMGTRDFEVECEVDWETCRIRPLLEDE